MNTIEVRDRHGALAMSAQLLRRVQGKAVVKYTKYKDGKPIEERELTWTIDEWNTLVQRLCANKN